MILNFFGANTTPEILYRFQESLRYSNPHGIRAESIANYNNMGLKMICSGAQPSERKSENEVFAQARQAIDSGIPIAVRMHNAEGREHWVVIYGYRNGGTNASDFLVLDPGIPTNRHTEEWTLEDTYNRYPSRPSVNRWIIYYE
jgi:hypothetical protein